MTRPIIPMGKDIGFLPGGLGDKLNPWMQPIFDNLGVILHTPRDQVKDRQGFSKYKNFCYLQLKEGVRSRLAEQGAALL